MKTKIVLCPDHLNLVEELGKCSDIINQVQFYRHCIIITFVIRNKHYAFLVGDDAKCAVCDTIGDLSKMLFCFNCWRHYHGNCLQPEVDVSPIVRMAWQCSLCKVCNSCG